MQEEPLTIVGLGGKIGCGKDTVASILEAEHGFIRTSFAQPLKRLVYHSVPGVRDVVDAYGWEGAKEESWIRTCLQEMGTNARNFLKPDIWVEHLSNSIQDHSLTYGSKKYVISDVRFNNEVAWIRSMEGKVVKIVRTFDLDGHGQDDHESENALLGDWYDRTMYNDGLMDDLALKTDDLVRWLSNTS